MFRQLLPKEVCFFDYFEQLATLTLRACEEFRALTDGSKEGMDQVTRIKEVEHEADEVTHRCIEALNKTFITPFDRTDIHLLIKRLDDIVDAVDASTSRLVLYELTEIRPEACRLAEVLVKASQEVQGALIHMRNMKNTRAIYEHLIAIHQLENEGDAILKEALARLFKEEEDRPVLVIKWKEIFERLERATDRCEGVANMIEKIVIEAS